MTNPTPDLVVSGVPFPVREVGGRAPSSLGDFLGDATLVVEDRSGLRSVTGTGHQDGDAVRVHEKADGTGKDVRVWNVRVADDGFTAETA